MFLNTPIEIYWCLTDRCNLKCNFCLSDSDLEPRENELDSKQRARILQDLIECRILKVYLTGGEPLLIPETLDYVNKLKKNGIFTVLTTNSLLLDTLTLKKLADDGLDRIQVSIHGATPEVNDAVMGGSSYHRIMKRLEEIRKINMDLHLKVTLTAQNIRELPLLMDQLSAFHPSLINISEVLATGRGFQNYEAIRPAIEDLLQARDQAAALTREGLNVSFRSHTLAFQETGRPSTCTVGNEHASACLIMPDGNLIPCTSAHVWGLSNNVLENGIQAAWEQMPLYAQFVQPDKLEGRCRTCELVQECKGGCRTEAYCYTHNIWGEYTPCVRLSSQKEESIR